MNLWLQPDIVRPKNLSASALAISSLPDMSSLKQ